MKRPDTSAKKEISAKVWVTEAKVFNGCTVLTIDIEKISITNVVYFMIITVGVLFLFTDLFEKLVNINFKMSKVKNCELGLGTGKNCNQICLRVFLASYSFLLAAESCV